MYQLLVRDNQTAGKVQREVDAGPLTTVTAVSVNDASDVVSVTPTVTANSAYTAGNAVGAKQTLSGLVRLAGQSVVLNSVVVQDKSNQKANLTILFFDADPSAGTYTDKAALVLSTDLAKVVGKVNVATADYETVDSKAVAVKTALNLVMELTGTALYAALLTTGTPTYTSTDALTVKYGFK